MYVRRALAAALAGGLFLLFVGVDLMLFGVLALDSALVPGLALLGLVLGGLGGVWGARRSRPHPTTPTP